MQLACTQLQSRVSHSPSSAPSSACIMRMRPTALALCPVPSSSLATMALRQAEERAEGRVRRLDRGAGCRCQTAAEGPGQGGSASEPAGGQAALLGHNSGSTLPTSTALGSTLHTGIVKHSAAQRSSTDLTWEGRVMRPGLDMMSSVWQKGMCGEVGVAR